MRVFKARKGRFLVMGFDSFDMEYFRVSEHTKLKKATEVADSKGGSMTLMYVFDDQGKKCCTRGTF